MHRIALASFLAVAALPAVAADIRALPARAGLPVLAVAGDLQPGDAERLGKAARELGRPMLVLSVAGGDVSEGMAVGRLARSLGMPTYVGAGAVCGAACGLAWLGGPRRYLEPDARVDLSGIADRSGPREEWGIPATAPTGLADAAALRAGGIQVLDAVPEPSAMEMRSIAAAASRFRSMYRENGMAGLSGLVRSCYAGKQPKGRAALAGCRAMDHMAERLDAKASEDLGFPRQAFFEPGQVAGRTDRAMDAAKVPAGERTRLIASWDAAAARAFAKAAEAD